MHFVKTLRLQLIPPVQILRPPTLASSESGPWEQYHSSHPLGASWRAWSINGQGLFLSSLNNRS